MFEDEAICREHSLATLVGFLYFSCVLKWLLLSDYLANFPFIFKILKAGLFVFQVCQTLLSDMKDTAQRCGHRRLPECTDVLVTFKRLKIMTELGIVFVRVSTDFYNSERACWRIC